MPNVSLRGIEFTIKGTSNAASASVDKLIQKLSSLNTELAKSNNAQSYAKGIESIAKATEKLSNLSLDGVASVLGQLAQALQPLKEVGDAAKGVGAFANGLAKLADKPEGLADVAVVLAQIAAIDFTNIKEAGEGLRNIAAAANSLAKIPQATKETGDAAKKANLPLNTFLKSLGRIAFYRIIRGILKSITQAFQEGLKNAYMFDKVAGGGLADALDNIATKSLTMKNQLGAAFGGLLQVITPVILTAIELITKLATAISALFGMFSGSGGYLKAKDTWTEWGEAAAGAGGAAKEALKYLAPFDELNVLPSQKGGGGGGSATPFGDMFEWTEFEEGSFGQTISDFIKENLEAVEALSDLFMFAIGLILVCSGTNILLGLGLMAIGGYKLYQDASANWDAIVEQLRGPMGIVTALVSDAALAVGAILAFSGVNVPVGIALMAVGAVGLAATVAANWDTILEALRGPVGDVVAFIASATLMLGFIAIAAGFVPLGIGLMAAGSVGLGAEIAANWDAIADLVGGPVNAAVAVIAGASLLLGAILMLTGNVPLGLGLMAVGAAAAIGTAISANWEEIVNFGRKVGEYFLAGWNELVSGIFEVGEWVVNVAFDLFTTTPEEEKMIFLLLSDTDKFVDIYLRPKLDPEGETPDSLFGEVDVEANITDFLFNGAHEARLDVLATVSDIVVPELIVHPAIPANAVFDESTIALSKEATTIPTTALYKYYGNALSDKAKKIATTAMFIKTDGSKLGDSSRKIRATANFTKSQDSITAVKWRLVNAIANFKETVDNITKKGGTVFESTAKFTNSYKKYLKKKEATLETWAMFTSSEDGFKTRPSLKAKAAFNEYSTANMTKPFILSKANFDKYAVEASASDGYGRLAVSAWAVIAGYTDAGGGFTLYGNGANSIANNAVLSANIESDTNDADSEEVLYRAMIRALNDSDIGGDINLDGDVLFRNMVTRNRRNTRLTGVNAMA